MKMSVYSRNDEFLLVFPDQPQWMVVDSFARDIAQQLFLQGKSIQQVVESCSMEVRGEAQTVCEEIVALTHGGKDKTRVDKPLTSNTTVAMISLTRNCNLSCPHCYVDARGARGVELSAQEHRFIAKQIKKALAPNDRVGYQVNLTGGEPFIHPEVTDIISAYHEAGFRISMSTNALLIRQGHLDLLRKTDAALSVSLDGATPITHDMIRGNGTFEVTTHKVKWLAENGIKVGINSLVHSGNIHELGRIISLAHNLGCAAFNPINLVHLGRACQSNLERASEAEIFRSIADHLVKNHNQQPLFRKTSLFSSLGAALLGGIICASCGVGDRPCVYITSEGDVFPCTNTQHSPFLLGNIRQHSLAECLDNGHPVYVRLQSLDVDSLNHTCSQCDIRYFCGGDCRGETYNVTGNLRAPYVHCSDRHGSIIELMWIAAEHPELFEERSAEYVRNADRQV